MPDDEPRRPVRVLLAEDPQATQQILTPLLQQAGHQVETVRTGPEALLALEKGGFDLLLMDLGIAEMDGRRAARLIRAREKAVSGRIPIVALAAAPLPGERERCLAAGMDDYLVKPVPGQALEEVIVRLVPRAPRAGAPVGGPSWGVELQQVGFDREALADLARTFLTTTPERVEALRRGVAAADPTQVFQAAHSLKGTVGVFGAREAVAAAQQLEAAGRARKLEGTPALLEAFLARYRNLERELADFVAREGEPPPR